LDSSSPVEREDREVEDFDSTGESKGEWPVELGTEEEFVTVRRRADRF
jgi:hypothetical protein